MFRVILGLLFAAAVTFVALNAHMDIFPCIRKDMNFSTGSFQRHEGTCSLLYVYNQDHLDGEGGELTGMGYAVAAGVCGLLPFVVGFWLGGLFRRKRT